MYKLGYVTRYMQNNLSEETMSVLNYQVPSYDSEGRLRFSIDDMFRLTDDDMDIFDSIYSIIKSDEIRVRLKYSHVGSGNYEITFLNDSDGKEVDVSFMTSSNLSEFESKAIERFSRFYEKTVQEILSVESEFLGLVS